GQYHVQQQQMLHNLNAPAAASTVATTGTSGGGAAPSAASAAGATVYTANCAGCHGAAGTGQPGVFPPLANNPVVTGPAAKLIAIVNSGLSTPITVNGASYTGTMPPWKG